MWAKAPWLTRFLLVDLLRGLPTAQQCSRPITESPAAVMASSPLRAAPDSSAPICFRHVCFVVSIHSTHPVYPIMSAAVAGACSGIATVEPQAFKGYHGTEEGLQLQIATD